MSLNLAPRALQVVGRKRTRTNTSWEKLQAKAGARLLAGPLGAMLPRAWSEGVWARWA